MKQNIYMTGDLVQYGNDGTPKIYAKVNSVSQKGVITFADASGSVYPKEELISGIPLTPAILEKNGWNKSVGQSYVGGKKGYKYTKELEDDYERSRFGDLQICQCENLRDWNYINECNNDFVFEFTYVHELQHILFAFGINSEMEI